MSSYAAAHDAPEAAATNQRKARLSLLARAPHDRIAELWDRWCGPDAAPPHEVLRVPQIGTVMVRGRMGGTGAAFNLGEMTVTRCTIRLDCGTVGHGHVQGRSPKAARAVALIDALLEAGQGAGLEEAVLTPLRETARIRADERAAKAAATKVEFFTMVRGES